MATKQLTLKPQRRSFALDRAAVNDTERTIALSFVTETPVPRYFGNEILDCGPESVRLDRLKATGPLLYNHDPDCLIGKIEQVSMGSDRRGHAIVRLSDADDVQSIWQKVQDGTLCNVSVGYQINRMILEASDGEVDTYRAMDWEPYEISLVSVPADINCGVGRSDEEREVTITIGCEDDETPCPGCSDPECEDCNPAGGMEPEDKGCAPKNTKGEKTMSDISIDKIQQDTRDKELSRVRAINQIAADHKAEDLARDFINSGKSADEFGFAVLERYGKATPVKPADQAPDISAAEQRDYSLMRAIAAAASGDWSKAGYEREVSQEIAKTMGRAAQGFFVPFAAMSGQRDLTVGTSNAGGYTKQTDLLAGQFIDALRNKMVLQKLGARYMTGLQGDVAIPKLSSGATAYWVAENGAPTESQQTFAQVTMAPKTVGAYTDISRRLLLQSSLDVNAMVADDLNKVLAIALDLAGINGSGSSNQPTGILSTSGIGSVAGGTNGATPTWANMLALCAAVEGANADAGKLAFLTNPKAKGYLSSVAKFSNTATPIWDNGQINGYAAAATNQVPSNLTKGSASGTCSAIIFGNFDDLLVGIWGNGIDLLVDPYTGSSAGTVRVRALLDADIAVRNAVSFAAMQDALTTGF